MVKGCANGTFGENQDQFRLLINVQKSGKLKFYIRDLKAKHGMVNGYYNVAMYIQCYIIRKMV